MPASVGTASPSTVLPKSLCTAFTESREYRTQINEYHDGSSERQSMTTTSRKAFKLTKRLNATDQDALLAFYKARKGSSGVFFFYNTRESANFAYDVTGVATQGRYTVRFDGELAQELGIGRHSSALGLVEVL
jgi:hypothetical protein